MRFEEFWRDGWRRSETKKEVQEVEDQEKSSPQR
jgi:hypothetical protein